jgi:type I restriction enzyme S subunit
VSELPKSWVVTRLGDFAYVKNGFAFKSKHYVPTDTNTVPVIRISDIQNEKAVIDKASHVHKDNAQQDFLIVKDDLLIAMSGATTGKTGVYKSDVVAYQNQRVGNIKLHSKLLGSNTYKNYLIASLSEEILKKAYGAAQPNISGKSIEDILVAIAPLNEQTRIADKLDSMLAKVDAAQARLDKIPNILKRFRQSVLAAATSGELTKEWRETKDVNIDKWEVLRLEDVCNSVTDGDHQAPPKAETGVPFLVISNVNKGAIDLDKASRWVPQSYFDSLKDIRKPLKGDILYTVTGSYGIPVEVHDDSEFCFQRHIAILKPNHSLVDKDYLFHFLSSSNAFEQATKHATGTAQKTLPLRGLRGFEVTIPSMGEQKEIVRRVGAVFNMADTVEKQYIDAKARTNRLTQSILAKAFRGKLVEQDPNDESADKLLARIKNDKKTAVVKKPITSHPPSKRKATKSKAVTAVNLNAKEVYVTLQANKKEMTPQQIIESMKKNTFETIDQLFVQLKSLLEGSLISQSGFGENAKFKVLKL